jgi:hypothetical protein
MISGTHKPTGDCMWVAGLYDRVVVACARQPYQLGDCR